MMFSRITNNFEITNSHYFFRRPMISPQAVVCANHQNSTTWHGNGMLNNRNTLWHFRSRAPGPDYDYRYEDPGYRQRYDRGYPPRQQDYYDDRNRDYRRRAPPPRREAAQASGGSAVGIVIRILIMIFIIAFFTLPQCAAYRAIFIDYLMAGLYKYQEVPDTVDFTVQRVMTIESDEFFNYTLYLPIPLSLKIDGKEAQLLKSYEQTPQYSSLLDSDNDNDPDHWVWHQELPQGGKATIEIVYHFRTAKISWDISIGKSGTINDISSLSPNFQRRYSGDAWPVKDYQDPDNVDTDNDGIPDDRDVDDDNRNGPDKYRIEPSNPTIRALLEKILEDEGLLHSWEDLSDIGNLNVYKVVKAIYDWIDDNCVYPTIDQQYDDAKTYGGYPKWATGTYNDRRGDCDDQSILFISLCRAAGIPAMLEIGALYDIQVDRWEGHGWANVYIPFNAKYRAEKGYDYVLPMVDIVNNIFLFRDPNRFSEWVDDGVKGKLAPSGEWMPSHLEDRYLAWEYYYEGSSVDTGESYITLEFDPQPPEKKLYI